MRFVVPILSLTCLLAALALAQPASAPTAPFKLKLSKETTVITSPLRPDGLPDYVAYNISRLTAGVTLDNNAFIPLLKTFGPGIISQKILAPTLDQLGIKSLPADGDYFQTFEAYLKSTGVAADAITKLQAEEETLASHPWISKRHPEIAAWLAHVDKHLDAGALATTRTRYYSPALTNGGDTMVDIMLPALSPIRDMARALALRSAQRAADGKLDAAWQDSLALHRLARLLCQGGTLIEHLVACAIETLAVHSDATLISTGKLTAAQAGNCLAEIQKLPPMSGFVEAIDVSERFSTLQLVLLAGSGKTEQLDKLLASAGLMDGKIKIFDLTAEEREEVDWNGILRDTNAEYDLLVQFARKARYSDRVGNLYRNELERSKSTADLAALAAEPDVNKRIRLATAAILTSLWRAAILHERAETFHELDELGFALAQFRAQSGAYPKSLDLLTPKYLPQIPQDRFVELPLHYSLTPDGFLLYSLGDDMHDDGGAEKTDKPGQLDLTFRVSQ